MHECLVAPDPVGWWWTGAVLLERPSSAVFSAATPMEMREQLE
jgi:hypothetical protein